MNYTCQKCGKSLAEIQFYTYKDGSKTELCKKCMTMHVDNFNPETFLWLLEKMDVPYIEAEWNSLRDKAFAKDPLKMNGTSVFGKYISKMKLKQWKDYGWADTERLKIENEEKQKAQRLVAETNMKQMEEELLEKYQNGEISEAEFKTYTSTPTQNEAMENGIIGAPTPIGQNIPTQPKDPYMSEEELEGPVAELTDEDKLYLAMKWGRLYKPSEWISLEKSYNEMMESFDIQDADTINTLILICKTNLKMNQAVDIGDMEGFQKLSRVYESLRKSAKFTAAQNKEKKEDYIDSVGELIVMCEKEGFIPRYATDIPQDKVDYTLKDMNDYLHTLVTQDLGFGQQIEDALKKIQIQKEMQQDLEETDFEGKELEDEDYEAFYEEMERQRELDRQLLEGEMEEDE